MDRLQCAAAARSKACDLEAERDAYLALNDAIKARAEDHEPGHEAKTAGAPKAPVLDLMAALKAGIDETRTGREGASAKRTPRKAG